ncbi:MAG TPA: hypothetical protein VGO43_08850, partial [Pyrinomonadaceae bacterium]|nr:hypothetical protein [Pyrinomonadaceae bacterium]
MEKAAKAAFFCVLTGEFDALSACISCKNGPFSCTYFAASNGGTVVVGMERSAMTAWLEGTELQ